MKKILLFGVLGMVGLIAVCAVVVATSGGSGGKAKPTVPTGTPVPPLTVTVEEIHKTYKANEARANATYKERLLDLYFSVDEIEDDYVRQDLGTFDSAQLKFSQDELIAFNVGDKTNRVCELEGFDLDTFLRFDCR